MVGKFFPEFSYFLKYFEKEFEKIGVPAPVGYESVLSVYSRRANRKIT